MYIRKTKDVHSIVSNYGYGFEETCGAESYSDAKRLLKEYRENQQEYAHKIRLKRVRIEEL